MSGTELRLEPVLRLLPELEELDGLRAALIRVARPDPGLVWARAGSYATLDKRILVPAELDVAVAEAEAAFRAYSGEVFDRYRTALAAYADGDPDAAAAELIALGERKEALGHYRSAVRYFDAALSLSLPSSEKRMQILALRRLARVARAGGDLEAAHRHYRRSAELARDSGDVAGEVVARTGIGHVLGLQGRWREAAESSREALAVVESVPNGAALRLERGQLYNNLGYFETRRGDLAAAGGWLERAMEVWAEVDSPQDLGVALHCLAGLRRAEGRLEEGRELYERALALDLPPAFRAGVAIDLADWWLRAGHTVLAMEWSRAAEEHAIASRSPYILGRVYQVRGNLARESGSYDGLTFYEKALEIAREKSLPVLEGETLMDYAALRARMGEREEAASYLQHAAEIFAGLGAEPDRKRALELLAGALAGPEPLEEIAGA